MNKVLFNIRNGILAYKFWSGYKKNKIEYPAIQAYMDKKYGAPEFVDHFENLDHWNVLDKTNWGSSRPGNLCTFVKENVSIRKNAGSGSLVITTTPDPATGKGWEGEEIPRPFSSGLVTSQFLVKPGQVVTATVNTTQSYPGSWFSFWLHKKDVPGEDRYREADIFEKFMERKNQKQYTISVHGVIKGSREMMSFSYPMFFVNEENLTFTCELQRNLLKIYVNGICMFITQEPDFDGEYYVVFDDAPTTHDGKVKTEDITAVMPREFEIIDFRVYKMT
jgi:hypothetical protein